MRFIPTSMPLVLLVLLGSAQFTTAEEIVMPDREINFSGCYSDLVMADGDSDGFVYSAEYLVFVQAYGKRVCAYTNELSLQQLATFNTLACICRSQDNTADDCCLGSNAQIPTSGAETPVDQQTPNQKNYLTSVCKLTDATIDGQCPPVNNTAMAPASSPNSTNSTNSTNTTGESAEDTPEPCVKCLKDSDCNYASTRSPVAAVVTAATTPLDQTSVQSIAKAVAHTTMMGTVTVLVGVQYGLDILCSILAL
jgi:hypothetical protein